MRLTMRVLTAAIGAGCVVTVAATPIPALDIEALVKASDVVALGSVDSVVQAEPTVIGSAGGAVSGRVMVARLRVVRWLKGTSRADEQKECRFTVPTVPLGYETVQAGSFRMFFLRGDDDTCEFASPYYLSLPAVVVNDVVGETPIDRVAFVLGEVLNSEAVPLADRIVLVSTLSRVRSPHATGAMRRLLKSSDPSLRASGAGALLAQNDLLGLPEAEHALLRNPAVSPSALGIARNGLALVSDPAAVPALTRLLGAPNVQTRRAAVEALKRTKSQLAIQPLLRALDDEDDMVRYPAVMGLFEITGDLTDAPSIEAFRRTPEQFVQFWKDWARRRNVPAR
jgi:hypothetical protein